YQTKCINCGDRHKANYHQCPVRLAYIKKHRQVLKKQVAITTQTQFPQHKNKPTQPLEQRYIDTKITYAQPLKEVKKDLRNITQTPQHRSTSPQDSHNTHTPNPQRQQRNTQAHFPIPSTTKDEVEVPPL